MNKYLIFRTDRIGDFLLTAILVNSIKRNDTNAIITIVSSEKNYDYIKSFKSIDEVILLKNDLNSKIKLIKRLRASYYKYLIIHDGKKRSSIISFFLKYGLKIKENKKLNHTHINTIKKILSDLNFDFIDKDLNTLKDRNYNNLIPYPDDDFILFHFDEKWIYKDYISKYTRIEPTKNDLLIFINLILKKSNKKLIITTGVNFPIILNDIINDNLDNSIKIYKNLNFLELEGLISKCKILISCHGSVSHVAAANQVKQIDIIEKEKLAFYFKWTAHFRNHSSIFRKRFSDLSKEVLQLL